VSSGSRQVRPHGERSCNQGSSAEPGEPGTAVGGRVEPGRENGEQREGPVEIVEPVRGAAVIGEQEQPEPDLRDEERLRERDQVRDEAPGFTPAVIREPGEDGSAEGRGEDEECNDVVGR
jgi:hypothetical protein